IQSVTIAGIVVTLEALEASNAAPFSITTPEGNVIEVVGFTQVGDNAYQIDYTFELLNPASHPVQGTDELAKEPITLSVTDQRGNVESAEVEVSIVDDVPVAEAVKEDISIPLTEAGVSGFKAGFLLEETTAINGSVSGEVLDVDEYADRLTWGTPANGSQGSNYVFEDNEDFRTGDTIFTDQLIELGTFTHNNFPILSSGSVLTSTILEVKFTLLIDGARVEIDARIELEHNETPNNNSNPQDPENDDIIKITNIDFVQTYEINDRVYEFKIKGFLDQDGNIVDEIRTTEQASNSFKLFAELASTADIPLFEGQVDYFWGADGAADEDPVIWKDIDAASGVIETDLGILTVNPDGSYSYQVKLETRDKLQLGEVLVDSFTYVLKDADGDLVESTLEIHLNGVSNTSRISVETEVDNSGPVIDVTGDTVGIPVGSELTVTITDQEGNTVTTTAIVEEDGSYTVTDLDISSLIDGDLDITVTGTDNNGDPVIGIADDVLDAVASAVEVSFDNTDANGVITDDADSVVISGSTTDVLPGSNTVNLVITDQQGNEVVLNDVALDADGNFSVEADLSGLIDGPLDVVASATDNNGNPITGTDNAELDAIAADITVETEVDNAGPTIDVTGDTTDIPVGSELVVTITDQEGNTVTTTAIVEEDGTYTVTDLDITDLTDGDLDITVTGTDNNGNPVTGTAEDELDAVESAVEVSFDNTDANGVITDDADSVVISGSTTDVLPGSNTVNLVITDQQGNEVILNDVALDADGNFSVEADLSGLIDGPLDVVASATDNNGNPITGTDNAELDAIAADITVETEVDNAGPTIDVTGDTTDIPVGSELVVTITDQEGNTVTTTAIVEEDGSYTVTDLDITDLTDGDLDITVTGTDNNGNPVTGTAEDALDSTASSIQVTADVDNAEATIDLSGATNKVPEGQ
ncbi:hypothetical protein DN062_18325, partial [Nitrincola tibetensis]